jgi:hypothetical protein
MSNDKMTGNGLDSMWKKADVAQCAVTSQPLQDELPTLVLLGHQTVVLNEWFLQEMTRGLIPQQMINHTRTGARGGKRKGTKQQREKLQKNTSRELLID